ncbi:MAG: acetoacetate--CoA ligase [bacterium]
MTQRVQIRWSLDARAMEQSAMHRFMKQCAARHGIEANWDALYRWSIDRRAAFWSSVWRFAEIRAKRESRAVLVDGDAMPGAKWFVGSRLNFAENLLRERDDRAAIIFRGENADDADGRRTLTYAQLHDEVARVSEWLREIGVEPGDRVAGYLPNCPQTVIAMLASASVGAIWSSCSPDFGVQGVLDRFGQIRPRVLFAADGYRYNGKRIELLDAVAEIAARLDSVEQVIIAPFLDAQLKSSSLPESLAGKAKLFDHFAATQSEIHFAQLPFDHPLYILYSSGTTGAPKCIVHSAGGTLIQHLKEHRLHLDLTRRDVFLYITTCGWMMWNWLVSALASGCAVVLYDGSPFFPRHDVLWRLAEELGITVFGASARYLAALEKASAAPGEQCDLSKLRVLLSTGSPLSVEGFDYVYRSIKSDLMLSSISGGTDIVSCFVLGNPLRAVYRGEIQSRGLGMAVEVYDADGNSVREQRGELVCTKPFPSMPLGFWGDDDQQRYREAYFSRFENVWAQGDYAEITRRDGVIIHGRSDAVLNPGGVRIGTAEIYRQVEKSDEVLESLCIGQEWDGDVRVVLFVVLREGARLDDALVQRIRDTVQANTTRRHVPQKIIAVPDIPRTRSGKIVELAVRSVVHGEAVNNTEALANPEALKHFRDLPELRRE